MPISLQSRQVGGITVVKCSGRIVGGEESAALQRHLEELLPDNPFIILDLGDVHFVDSSGLGLLVRMLARTQTANGGLKLCAVPDKLRELLRITHLKPIFESHDSEAEAISAFYQPATFAAASFRFDTDILCVEESADVLACVRELLRHAGYGVMTADNLPDAVILLQATQPMLVVVGTALRAAGTQSAEAFNKLAEGLRVVELPPEFSSREVGEAGRQFLGEVRAIMGGGARPVS